jgi:hypothetical protein
MGPYPYPTKKKKNNVKKQNDGVEFGIGKITD